MAGEDPVADGARRLWRRVRVPLGLLVLAGTAIRNRDLLLSGEPFAVLTWVLLVGFWATVFFWPLPNLRTEHLEDADCVRATYRPRCLVWGAWTLVASAWLIASTVRNGWWTPSVITVVLPAVLLLSSLPGLLAPDRLAAWYRAAR